MMMSAAVNTLANPKGVETVCELCPKPAKLRCTKCRVTFYCGPDHQEADWISIHEKVCQLLVSLDTPARFHRLQGDGDEHRAEILKKQEQLIEIARLEAQRWLSQQRFQNAIPAALVFLRRAMRVYKSSDIQLVPAYLLLAQANIGLGAFSQAREYLFKAEWTVTKTPDCSRTILHQLHRTQGRLHAATGKFTSALTHFANDIYYACEVFGLKSTATHAGYFLMADVFLKQNKPDIARSFYTEVADFWHGYLCKLMEGLSQQGTQPEECFDEAQCVDTDQMLRCILEYEEQNVKPHPNQSAMLAHALAMLWFLGNNYAKALEYGRKAEILIQGSSENNLKESVQNLLQHTEEKLNTTRIKTH